MDAAYRWTASVARVDATDDFADDLAAEAAPHEESHLSGATRGVGSRSSELALPQRPRSLEFGLAQLVDHGPDEIVLHLMGAQFLPNPGRTETRTAAARQNLDEALLGQQLLCLERRQQGRQLFGAFGVRRELAGELGTAVLTARQIAQRSRKKGLLPPRALTWLARIRRLLVHGGRR